MMVNVKSFLSGITGDTRAPVLSTSLSHGWGPSQGRGQVNEEGGKGLARKKETRHSRG
jgi:hypothetical protein